jgi:phosphofructokinase-like protein
VTEIRRLGILTGGGDAPGLNAVIRAVVKSATFAGVECVGLEDGFDGLMHPARARPLGLRDVAGIHRLGGTILGTTNRGNPLGKPPAAEAAAYATRCLENFRQLDLQALIAVGGDGTLAIAHALSRQGIPLVGVPKTIDNDITETATSFGFDSAVSFATDALDRLHATAEAHRRIMVVEVMGRYTGWIGLYAAIAGGADVALIPEMPFHYDRIVARVEERERCGARCSIVVASEGAFPAGGSRAVAAPADHGAQERLGGIGQQVAAELQRLTGKEARYDVLGHLQRGGPPSSVDRVLATRFGVFAVELARRGEFGVMVALDSTRLAAVSLDLVVGRTRFVPIDGDLVRMAKAVGICFGD